MGSSITGPETSWAKEFLASWLRLAPTHFPLFSLKEPLYAKLNNNNKSNLAQNKTPKVKAEYEKNVFWVDNCKGGFP